VDASAGYASIVELLEHSENRYETLLSWLGNAVVEL
jgi:hypothetical protein